MDLPTCPSCGQSVLDDDADDCPFCGASMSGRPSSKPASAGAEKATTATAKPKAEKKEAPADDDPFDVATPVTGKTIALSPKPVKGRLHRIVCPMCETPGFSSKKAAGKQVKCANAECLVPIFTAPPLEGEVEEAPRSEDIPAQRSLLIPLIIGSVVVMGAIGGGAYYIASQPDTSGDGDFELPPVNPNGTGQLTDNGTGQGTDPDGQNGNGGNDKKNNTSTPTTQGPTVAELHKQVQTMMIEYSREREGNNRKPWCRQQTAEAFALAGDFAGMQEQLDQIDRIAARQPYLKLPPIITAAWQHLRSGDKTATGELATQAGNLLETIRQPGPRSVEGATTLATLLVALGKQDQAVALFQDRTDDGALGQFLEARSRAAVTGGFNLDQAVRLRPTVGWSAPQRVAVTVALAARGYSAEALQWAKSAPDSRSVRDCLAAWTEALILSGKSKDAVTAIDAEIADRSPADQTWILSRVALVLGTTGQPEQAGQMLTRARQVLTKTGTPSPAPFPELKQLCNLQLPDTSALRDAAVAATELAHSEAVLKQGDAWKTISLAQEFARAMAPSPTIARTPLANIRQFGDASVKTEIKRELRLLMDTEVDAAYKKYRANCQALEDAAIARFALQTEIVSAAVSWGLADQAWAEISQRAAESIDPTAVEPWLTTTVPYGIHEHYRVSGETGKLQTLLGAVPDKTFKDTKDLKVFYGAESLRVIAEGKETAAAKGLSAWRPRSENDSYWRQEMTLRLASQLVAAGKNAKALEYALAIDDSLLREMALELVAAQSTVAGDRTTAFEAARNPGLIPPDRVALLRGLVGGLPAE